MYLDTEIYIYCLWLYLLSYLYWVVFVTENQLINNKCCAKSGKYLMWRVMNESPSFLPSGQNWSKGEWRGDLRLAVCKHIFMPAILRTNTTSSTLSTSTIQSLSLRTNNISLNLYFYFTNAKLLSLYSSVHCTVSVSHISYISQQ